MLDLLPYLYSILRNNMLKTWKFYSHAFMTFVNKSADRQNDSIIRSYVMWNIGQNLVLSGNKWPSKYSNKPENPFQTMAGFPKVLWLRIYLVFLQNFEL